MYKKYIELVSWWKIWIKPVNDNEGTQLQIKIQDKKWDIILESSLMDQRTALRIIELLVNKNDIEDFVESNY